MLPGADLWGDALSQGFDPLANQRVPRLVLFNDIHFQPFNPKIFFEGVNIELDLKESVRRKNPPPRENPRSSPVYHIILFDVDFAQKNTWSEQQ